MRTTVFIGTCVLVMLIPFFQADTGTSKRQVAHEFITTFRHSGLSQVEMSLGESKFYSNFPGVTGYFVVDGRPGESVFLRYTEEPTRMLHSAEGCYRASGCDIGFTDNVLLRVEELSDEAVQWSQFRISDRGEAFLVRQCVMSLSSGKVYADVPAWYWQTTFSSEDRGPWLAVTWKLPEPATCTSSDNPGRCI